MNFRQYTILNSGAYHWLVVTDHETFRLRERMISCFNHMRLVKTKEKKNELWEKKDLADLVLRGDL